MKWLEKALLNYYIYVGTFIGILPFKFDKAYKASLSNILRVYSIFYVIAINIIFPLSNYTLFHFFRGKLVLSNISLDNIVGTFAIMSQNTTMILIAFCLIFKNHSKVFELVNFVKELSTVFDVKISKKILFLSYIFIILLQFISNNQACGGIEYLTICKEHN